MFSLQFAVGVIAGMLLMLIVAILIASWRMWRAGSR